MNDESKLAAKAAAEKKLYLNRTALKKKKTLPDWTNQESGSVANVFSSLNEKRDINKTDKKLRPSGDKPLIQEKVSKEPKTRIQSTIGSLFSGNATDMRDDEDLKVSKKYQDRVNKITNR